MKIARIVALMLMAAVPVLGDQQPSGSAKLESLHGTMVMMISDDEGVPAKLWAKGNNTRVELTHGNQKVITIQFGDTMYTYIEGSRTGTKQHLGSGLGSMGLIKQIEEILAKGKKEGSEKIEGVRYDKYVYGSPEDREMAVVYLSPETSLPRIWLSAVKTDDKTASLLRMHYRDMNANVGIPDEMFKLPPDVTFSEESKTRPH